MHAGDRGRGVGRLARAVGDHSLVAGVVEHRAGVVGHPAVDRDIGPHSRDLLHRSHPIGGDPCVADQRASGLDQDPRRRVEDPPHPLDLDLDVVLDRGRLVGVQVGDPEPAADVEQLGLEIDRAGEVGEHLDRLRVGLELEDLGADVGVEADELHPPGGAHPLDRALGEPVGEAEAELRVELPGLHVVMGGRLDSRGEPDQHPLRPIEETVGALDLVERIEDQVADARVEGVAELGLGLVVAVHVNPSGIEAGGERHVQLPTRRDVGRKPLLDAEPIGRRHRQRFAREQHLVVAGALLERPPVLAGPPADVVLGIDVGRRAELLGELDQVTPGDLEAASLVHPRATGVDRRSGDRIGRDDRSLVFPGSAHRAPF